MEENPRRPRPNKRAHKAQSTSRPVSPPLTSSSSSSKDLDRFTRAGETGECSVDCTGQSCRSCSAALVADCVALCCCPLAVVSLIGLAFIKVPCAVGKRCFGRSKRKEKEKRKPCVGRKQSVGVGRGNEKGCFGKEEEFGVRIVRGRSRETVLEFGEKEGVETEAVEADKVLLEMYQLGHLGFGRVSYTETQPNGIIGNR
ncbi:hypothetical protein V2J09_005513 [Rumex salicifolius]